MRSDISPGNTFPDYELPDHTSTLRKLSDLQGEDPLILTLARGHYCPKEHQQHRQLAEFYPQVAVAYTQMVTISTDDHHTLQEFRASVWTPRGLGHGRAVALPRVEQARSQVDERRRPWRNSRRYLDPSGGPTHDQLDDQTGSSGAAIARVLARDL
jgi:hypothetical protein